MSRILLGEVFSLKSSLEEIRGELIPSFDRVLDSWVSGVKGARYADPEEFFEITYLTRPLRLFIERVSSNLSSVGVFGGSLERGFGFGKTHSLILLWHLFTSDIAGRRGLGVSVDDVKKTLVLGVDFSKERPFIRLISLLKAYGDSGHSVVKIKDHKLVQAVRKVITRFDDSELYSLSSEKLAEVIVEILEKYSELGGDPKLLLLIDELGYGLVQRVRRYADYYEESDRHKANEVYSEANYVIHFLSYLYEKLQGKPYSSVIIWVLAEQDRREISALISKYQDNESIRSKINGLISDLDSIRDRYSRGLAGTGIAELSYSPEHAIEIALHRILRSEAGDLEAVRDAFYSNMKLVANQLNLGDLADKYKGELTRFYPFSIGLINLFKKIMNPRDMPGTEYIRTILYIAAEAAEKALKEDATSTYTIGLKHLSLPDSVQAKLTGELEADWIQAVSDVEMSLAKMEEKYRSSAELASKYIFGKGATANILVLLESEDMREIDRYGSTLDEIQLEIIQSHKETDAFKLLENLSDALERVKAESARIEEREVDGKRYYLPSFFKTIYSKLTAYVLEEKKNIERDKIIPLYLREKGTVPSLFTELKVVLDGRKDDVSVSLLDFNTVWDVNTFLSHQAFLKAQNEGKLLVSLIPVWDLELYGKLYGGETSYDQLVEGLAKRLQAGVNRGVIKRPLHVVVLLPNLSKHRLDALLDKLVVYEGTKKFLQYLEKSSDALMERIKDYEKTLTKRKSLVDIINEDMKEKHYAKIKSKLEREISEARLQAQKKLLDLSRKIVASIVSLYSRAVYYSLDDSKFVTKLLTVSTDSMSSTEGLADYSVPKSLERFSFIFNGFLRGVIVGLNYQYNTITIMKAILDHYKREFRDSPVREGDKIEDVLENLMQGTYGVKPLSALVARDAIRLLNKQIIEYDDRSIEFQVDESKGLIMFKVVKKEKPIEEEVTSTTVAQVPPVQSRIPGSTVSTQPVKPGLPAVGEGELTEINLELPTGFNVDDLDQKLTVLLDHYDVRIQEMSFRLDTERSALVYTVKDVESVDDLRGESFRPILNLLSRLSGRASKSVSVVLRFGEPFSEAKVKEVFEDYLTVRRSFDRLLP